MRILFVGQNPAQKSPHTAFKNTKSGERLLRICNLADIDHSLVDFENVFPHPTLGNKKPSSKEIEKHLPRLKRKLSRYRMVVACGAVAQKAISKIQKESGHTMGFRVFGIPHPSGLNRVWNSPRTEILAADIISYMYQNLKNGKLTVNQEVGERLASSCK